MLIEQTTEGSRRSGAIRLPVPNPLRIGWRSDRLGILGLLVVTLIASVQLSRGGTVIGQDSATQFYPWYDYLGERLSSGELPGWNPYQFAGAPFAADPQSGWMYVPAMAIFSLLSLSWAVPVFIVFHLALAGTGTYVLSRLLGMGVGAAVVAAVTYELASPVYGRSVCCPAHIEIGAWMPVALVGAELAARTRDRAWRIIGWSITGLAISQALGAWLGQGGYYFLLLLAAYMAYRTLIAPPDRDQPWPRRFGNALLHGGAVLAIGFGLAAAGILPRLEYVARSNVAGGEYGGSSAWASDIGGVTPTMIATRMLEPSLYYPGVAAVVLAGAAIVLARGRHGSAFFLLAGLGAVLLATPWDSPLHLLLYAVLPRFEELHQHWPDRVAIVGYLSFAMLAGAAVEALGARRIGARQMLAAIGIPVLAVAVLVAANADLPAAPMVVTVLTLGLLASLALPTSRWVRPALAPVMATIIAVDLLVSFNGVLGQGPFGGFHRVDLDDYYAENGAVTFLRERMDEEPGRYVGFDNQYIAVADGQVILYRYQFASPETGALLVNNRGVLHGVEDAQGYNPVQPARFVDYLTALNGRPQEYHDANVYPTGFDSPLLDLLNIRYIVIPTTYQDHRVELAELDDTLPTIYADHEVQVLLNPDALPRAWIVHQARQAEPDAILTLLATGMVDPRETALLETAPPLLEAPTGDAISTATLTGDEPEALRIETRASAPGLLMLSETNDPNWRAYVDGEEVELYTANYLLRAVPIPAGEHVVELRYEPASLRAGLAISGLTAVIVFPALAWAIRRVMRDSMPPAHGTAASRRGLRPRRDAPA